MKVLEDCVCLLGDNFVPDRRISSNILLLTFTCVGDANLAIVDHGIDISDNEQSSGNKFEGNHFGFD